MYLSLEVPREPAPKPKANIKGKTLSIKTTRPFPSNTPVPPTITSSQSSTPSLAILPQPMGASVVKQGGALFAKGKYILHDISTFQLTPLPLPNSNSWNSKCQGYRKG